jgi:peptidoglycan/xylan/chitin deacetylase (PgdA/CDA1 family)
VSVAAAPPPPPVSTKPTSVVLTFDDGTVGQDDAAKVIAGYGLHGTFYINSARLGMQDYLSAAQVKAIAADGNEIGGHTLDHADLTTLTSDDAARQVCDDRVALHDLGFKVTSFAYPFGAYNNSIQTTVKNCGYNNARIVASLRSNPYGCASCVTANAVPPADPYAIKTNTSVRADTTLATLQTYVTQAENDKGGLVPIVFHHIGSTGDVNEISLDLFTQFVDWLAHRPSTTKVVTMDQVMGGAVQPYVAGPALPTALNVLNPSLEAGSGVTPTCFNPTGYGSNSPTWSRDSSSAHTGSFGEGLTISSWTTGDRKLVIKQDVSGNACAPAGTPGHQYQPTVWYRGSWSGSTHANIVTYYRDVNGAWQVWATGANLAPSSSMQQASLTTSPLPAGATAVSFGLALVGTGQLSTDDYGMADIS